jgi:hypothetical protein
MNYEWRQARNGVSHSTFKIQNSKLTWRTLPAGCAALTCGYENLTLRVISLLLIRISYKYHIFAAVKPKLINIQLS